MDPLWLLSSALASGVAAGATGLVVRKLTRAPLERRLLALDAELARERSSARRRLDEEVRERTAAVDRLRVGLGLSSTPDAPALSGARLARAIVERLHGLVGVDAVAIADASGLGWTGEATEAPASLAAAGGEALRVMETFDFRCRELHVELADARHLVVRPIPGTMPALSLITQTSSRPTPAFALDATIAFAAATSGASGGARQPPDPLVGRTGQLGGGGSQVAANLQVELESARASTGARMVAVAIGDDVLAGVASDGPSDERAAALVTSLRALLGSFERRLGATARRIDLSVEGGSTVTFAPLGTAGRFGLLASDATGAVDPGLVDRMVGRLRRFLPAPTHLELSPRGVL